MKTIAEIPDPIAFDEKGVFYPMVTSFMCAVTGLESVWRSDNPMGFKKGEIITLEGKVHREIRVEPFSIHRLAVARKLDMPYLSGILCTMLINAAYESVKIKRNESELFEFFRHVRNAASHQNFFYFKDMEPKRPAEWRAKKIAHESRGKSNPLFGVTCFNNFLGIADAILLLWDVEQALLR